MKFTKRIEKITTSATLAITQETKRMRKEGIDVINLAAGEPDFDTPLHIKEAAIDAIKGGITKYTPAIGLLELRKAVSKKFKQDNNLSYQPEEIVVSCGAKHTLYNLLQVLCERGDEVIIPSPYWVSYPEMVRLASAEPVIAEMQKEDNFKLSPETLNSLISEKTKAIIINTPSNPAGSVYTKSELKGLMEVALSREVYIISDEIYEKLIYEGEHISIASLGKDVFKRTITVNGLSKSYSMTGWRIGYMGGPAEIAETIGKLQSHSTSNPTSISQMAAIAALRGDQGSVKARREEFRKRRDYIIQAIERIPKLSCIVPEGAFYIFCDILELGISSSSLSHRLLKEAYVATIPGIAFGRDDHIRLSFATSLEDIKKGMERIGKWVQQYWPKGR